MYFHQLLLFIIHKFNGERSQTASYYLLKGKKSGQTIQDVTYFQLHSYFSLFPKLSKETYDEAIKILRQNEYVQIENAYINLTEKGFQQVKNMEKPRFNGWLYRGNEQIFWKRVELIVQTLSQFKFQQKKFIPNQKDIEIQHFVKKYFQKRDFQSLQFYTSFKLQLLQLLESANLDKFQKELFVYRLSGYKKSGLTWDQLTDYYSKTELDLKFTFIECLHILIDTISREQHPDLFDLLDGIEVEVPLTESAVKTNNLFTKGYSIEEVAEMRFLKKNTIEDHVIEIVSANPDFPVEPFISNEQIGKVLEIADKYKSKKLKLIREYVPELSYFQIRLALTKGEEVNG